MVSDLGRRRCGVRETKSALRVFGFCVYPCALHALHEWHVHTSAACVCMAACAGLNVLVMSVPEVCDACCLFLRWDECRRRTGKDGRRARVRLTVFLHVCVSPIMVAGVHVEVHRPAP